MALSLPPIDKYFSDEFQDEISKKYYPPELKTTSPRYIRDLLGRDISDKENQYLHYYLGRQYEDLHVLPKFNADNAEGVAAIHAQLDFSKVNMIPVTISTEYDSHISVLIVNPECFTIEYYNTLCLGHISKSVEAEFIKLLPKYTFCRSELNFQMMGGADRLCEVWICFVAETRTLNRAVPFEEFNPLLKDENTLFQAYPTLEEQRQALARPGVLKMMGLTAKGLIITRHWYLQVVLAYALYFEHVILVKFIETDATTAPLQRCTFIDGCL